MNTTQRILAAALPKGIEVSPSADGQELKGVTELGEGRVVFCATVVGGRFYSGYTTDALGHVVSHSTVREFVAAI